MTNLEQILRKHSGYEPNPDLDLIRRAYSFAEVAHLGQKRLNGEDWLQHLLSVAELLTEVRADSATLAAAMLHDVLETSDLQLEDLEKEFGEEVASLVDGLTVIQAVSGKVKGGADKDWDNLRHLILASIEDPRVLIVRLANKIHNLRTSSVLPDADRHSSARKVFDLWSPLSEALGIYRFKTQLEDLAFAIQEPRQYRDLVTKIQSESQQMAVVVRNVQTKLSSLLAQNGIEAQIFSRTKHLWGIYRKMPIYRKDANGQLFDALGLRAVVSSVEQCYQVLDLARKTWEEVPGLFDDYIARPKPNGYQSIHAVFRAGGHLIEIQIRTAEMQEIAEYGSASHYIYKIGKDARIQRSDLIRQLIFWEKGQKLNLFPDKVFIFTPKGDVKVLHRGSTPVDFAFAVHTQLGRRCAGAKANGKAVSLDYPLQTGEVVEILTAPGRKPSAEWLRFVKTSLAREEIEKSVRRSNKELGA